MNILITSASRKVSLVRAFQQALAQEGGGKVIAVDVSPFAPALYFADEQYLVPLSNSRDYLDIMVKLCKKLDIKIIIPTRDEELPLFAKNKALFTDIGTFIMVPKQSTVEVCQDKKLFINFCRDHNLATPKTYDKIDKNTKIDFPLFIKPRYGKGGKKTNLINSQEELDLLLLQFPEVILQENVSAPEYTIDLFADFSGRVISAVPRERLYVFGGESFITKTHKHPKLIKESVRLAMDLNLTGHNTIQCFFSEDIVKFIEVNPRFGGAANLGFAAGAPTPLFIVKLLKGDRLEPKIDDFKDNYIMLRYTDDLFLNGEKFALSKGN